MKEQRLENYAANECVFFCNQEFSEKMDEHKAIFFYELKNIENHACQGHNFFRKWKNTEKTPWYRVRFF